MTDAPVAELVGQTIAGRYRVLRLVGEGGVGRVYEAEQLLGSSPRSVAVKLLRPEWSHDSAVQARFQREAALVAKLQHVNTVRIYDFGTTDDGSLYIAMEFLRGRALQQLLDERGALPPARVERIVAQIAASLQEAHDLGIIHRDLKPDNILLLEGHGSEHDLIKLLDFGIAKGQPSSGTALTKLTALGTFVGTPAYMSPEQFGGGPLGPESDLYSLAVTCHQMLSGRLPFEAESAMQWAQAHLGTAAPALAADCGAGPIPERMRRAVLQGLAKEPAQRPRSAAEFAREFCGSAERGASGEPGPERPASEPAPVAGPRTAPMTRAPEFAPPGGGAVAPTLPIPSPLPPRPAASRSARGGRGVKALLVAALVLGVAFLGLLGQQQRWFAGGSGSTAVSSEASSEGVEPAPVVIEPETAEAPPAGGAPAPETSASPAPSPTRPRPAPTPSVPPATAPPAASGTPALPAPPPVLPGPATPPAPSPAPSGTPTLPPGVQLPPGLQLPQLQLPPIPLPSSAGACERCQEALLGGGNGSVVRAAAEALLCNDRQGRQQCESQIREQSPVIAEQAARAGDCPAALATEAAGTSLGVPADRFRSVHALCVR